MTTETPEEPQEQTAQPAEENQPQTQAEQQVEHEETDWKAQARKWEKRAKQYKAKLDSTESDSEPTTTGEASEQSADDDLAKRLAQLEQENQQLKAKDERRLLVDKVAHDTGIPSTLLHGESEEDMRAFAKALHEWVDSRGHNTAIKLGSEPNTPKSGNIEFARELLSSKE